MDHSGALTPREKASLSLAAACSCSLLLLNEGHVSTRGVCKLLLRGTGSVLGAQGLLPALLFSLTPPAHLPILPPCSSFRGAGTPVCRSGSNSAFLKYHAWSRIRK